MGYVAMTTHFQCSNDSVGYKSVEKLPATVDTAATTAVRERRHGRTTDAYKADSTLTDSNRPCLPLTYKAAGFLAVASTKGYQQVFLSSDCTWAVETMVLSRERTTIADLTLDSSAH